MIEKYEHKSINWLQRIGRHLHKFHHLEQNKMQIKSNIFISMRVLMKMENWISSKRLEFKIILQSALFMIWFVETFDIYSILHSLLVVNYFSFASLHFLNTNSELSCGKKCCGNMWFESNDNILTIQMQEKWKVKQLLEFHDMPNAMVLLFLSMRTLNKSHSSQSSLYTLFLQLFFCFFFILIVFNYLLHLNQLNSLRKYINKT